MFRLFVVSWLVILYASHFALSETSRSKQFCSPTCSVCRKDIDPSSSCPNITCRYPGDCTQLTHDNCGCCLICAKQEGESCGGLYGSAGFCASHLRCNVSEKRSVAGKIDDVGVCKDRYCFRSCTNSRQPRVCASDGKWYDNECTLRKLKCENKTSAEQVDNSICEENCPTDCSGNAYKPVCGSDKKMYKNKCELKRKACLSNRTITVSPHQLCSNNPVVIAPCSQLRCGQGEQCVENTLEKKTDVLAKCQCIDAVQSCFGSIHVCASNGSTYRSECHMNAEACVQRRRLTIKHYGDCMSHGSSGDSLPGPPDNPPNTPQPTDPFHVQLKPRT